VCNSGYCCTGSIVTEVTGMGLGVSGVSTRILLQTLTYLNVMGPSMFFTTLLLLIVNGGLHLARGGDLHIVHTDEVLVVAGVGLEHGQPNLQNQGLLLDSLPKA
jgi:hypothetical protein